MLSFTSYFLHIYMCVCVCVCVMSMKENATDSYCAVLNLY